MIMSFQESNEIDKLKTLDAHLIKFWKFALFGQVYLGNR
jgi:hypothetical protein